jgi:D-alanine--poly(phosphoribitol) ligase subunit 1
MTKLHDDIAQHLTSPASAVSLGRAGDLSFVDLAARAAAILDHIGDLPSGQTVGILSSRKWEAYATVLACFFAGRCFVPLNPELPVGRLKKIVDQGHVGLITHDKTHIDTANDLARPTIDPAALTPSQTPLDSAYRPDPDAIVYQMFTSGSTGDPKGVPICYGNLNHYVQTLRSTVDLTGPGRYSLH